MLALRARLFGIPAVALKVPCMSCDYSLETAMVTKKKKDRDGALKKLVVVSPAVPPSLQTSRFVTGIEVHPQAATWARLDTHLCEIVDCGTQALFSDEVKASCDVLLKMAHKVKESIPPSDLYIFEDKPWTKGLHRAHTTMGINLLTLQGMLNVLLNSDYDPDKPQRVFFLQPKAILKLFSLKVGNERSSSQHVIQKMIKRSDVSYVLDKSWHTFGAVDDAEDNYGSLRWTNPDIVKRVWTRDDMWRENVSNAILAAHAFNELCLKDNSPAQHVLWAGRT